MDSEGIERIKPKLNKNEYPYPTLSLQICLKGLFRSLSDEEIAKRLPKGKNGKPRAISTVRRHFSRLNKKWNLVVADREKLIDIMCQYFPELCWEAIIDELQENVTPSLCQYRPSNSLLDWEMLINCMHNCFQEAQGLKLYENFGDLSSYLIQKNILLDKVFFREENGRFIKIEENTACVLMSNNEIVYLLESD